MNDTATPRAEAASLLASSFFEILCEEGITFETFESRSISIDHEVIASAMSIAIERLDAKLCDLVLYGHWEKDGFEAPDRDASYAEMTLGGAAPGQEHGGHLHEHQQPDKALHLGAHLVSSASTLR